LQEAFAVSRGIISVISPLWTIMLGISRGGDGRRCWAKITLGFRGFFDEGPKDEREAIRIG
jgi:hypothetical protein